jgi:hypothetical protein
VLLRITAGGSDSQSHKQADQMWFFLLLSPAPKVLRSAAPMGNGAGRINSIDGSSIRC